MVLDGENLLVETGLSIVYSSFVMGMVEELKRKGVDVMVEEVWCGGLLYADDIALVADSA